ncbi:group II intron maturase-specific domain-containing protein [Kitasatospora cathayae]|uniref:Group II intron maturase-specific domain-containing protein n=1 Tax=Kitasatospora cathayae TaxID=3004092 RepID=A0ABY7Q956_9ACTN|nr:group II intron maturase-specific domain-containing protein [Kitasatospora sp. HUAS 3-15]WBP89187.1 hypothetical protein O1G21_27305 [Kitasatospora sp. HUAS 3-15]
MRGLLLHPENTRLGGDEAAKLIRAQIRRWRLHLRSGRTPEQLAREINPVVRGWINYAV